MYQSYDSFGGIYFESKVVGSKRSPAMKTWRQNPDPFFSSKSQFLEFFLTSCSLALRGSATCSSSSASGQGNNKISGAYTELV